MNRFVRHIGKRQYYLKGLLLLLGIGYVLWHILFLTRFPFVHSDESWLSGLSRNIWATGDYSTTESFFDLYPRNPHAIKLFFHSLQILFIHLMGYTIFTFRLISLLFGLLTIVWFYKLSRLIFHSEKLAIGGALLFALDIQFIYASHFARQEIILLFILIFSLHFLLKRLASITFFHHILLGTFLGLSIGFHPNSLIITFPFVLIYLFHILFTKKLSISALLILASTVGCFAAGFIALSLRFDPGFIGHYASFGSQFGVLNPLSTKVWDIVSFYQKLYYGVSGTYYIPNIKLQFFGFASAFLLTVFKLYRTKNQPLRESIISILLAVLAINAGIILIGRFNQTSILFVLPLNYIFVLYTLESLKDKKQTWVIVALSITLLISSLFNIRPYLKSSYPDYLQQIAAVVPKDARVLANLNSEYYFNNGMLYDYRNLAYLKENGLSFAQYIQKNQIEYIIYPEEMDLIFDRRPRWNPVYGNVYPYYADMKHFLEMDCELVSMFSDPTYGMRITEYMNTQNWTIKIYRVKI